MPAGWFQAQVEPQHLPASPLPSVQIVVILYGVLLLLIFGPLAAYNNSLQQAEPVATNATPTLEEDPTTPVRRALHPIKTGHARSAQATAQAAPAPAHAPAKRTAYVTLLTK